MGGEMWMVQSEQELLSTLSAKQREALDLLILHKTSKEISRILSISPHTVDQRVEGAKRKLGAANRSELAQTYRHLVSICQQMTYEDSRIANLRIEPDSSGRPSPEELLIQFHPETDNQSVPEWRKQELRVLPKLFEGRWGMFVRLGAIAAIAFLFVASVLGGIAIFEVLTTLIARNP